MIDVEVQDIAVSKPCPYCGHQPGVLRVSGYHIARCRCGKIETRTYMQGYDGALIAWNKKVEEINRGVHQ